jgi:hypothetical protein
MAPTYGPSLPPRKRPHPSFTDIDEKYLKRNVLIQNQTKQTPWIDWNEFDSVASCLFDPSAVDTALLGQALERVAVWRIRVHQLPHAIESTASLAQILWREQVEGCSQNELKLALAMAIVRSINGLADVLQQQRATAASVAHLSSLLGIPDWLVQVRYCSVFGVGLYSLLTTLPLLVDSS